jgi:hypothetical protein
MFTGAPLASILVTLVLYILQGVVLGVSNSVTLYLASAGADFIFNVLEDVKLGCYPFKSYSVFF